MGLYNYIFWYNEYEELWYAIPRDEEQMFFGIDKNKAKGVYKSSNINTLITVVRNPTVISVVGTTKKEKNDK